MSLRIQFCKGTRKGKDTKPLRTIIKDEFIGKVFHVNIEDRTSIVRLFMNAFKEKSYNRREISRVRMFLNRFHLSKVEIHAVIFSLGFKYKNKYPHGQLGMYNIKIGDYYNHHSKSSRGNNNNQLQQT